MNKDTACRICGKPVVAKGLCPACYARAKRTGEDTPTRHQKKISRAENSIWITAREKDIVEMLLEGKTYTEMAEKHGVSKSRIDNIIRGMMARKRRTT